MSTENVNTPQAEENAADVPAKSKLSNGAIINVVLFVGIILLYVLQFKPSVPQEEQTVADEEVMALAQTIKEGAFNIAFVRSDSLMQGYALAQKMRGEFEREQKQLEDDLARRQRTFQLAVETFQSQIQRGAIDMQVAQQKEQELMQEQQEIMMLNESYSERLMVKEMQMNTELYQNISTSLRKLNEELGYDYILGYTIGGGILYASAAYDITSLVIKRLNEEYEAK